MEPSTCCMRVSRFSFRYSETTSFATRAASSGDSLSKPTENAMVAFLALPPRSSTPALIMLSLMSLRMRSTSASRVMLSRSSP